MCRLSFAALLAFAAASSAADKFDDLTSLLPPQVNAAMVIDVEMIYDSPLAQKEQWATRRPLPFPPTLYAAALATRIDLESLSGGTWEVGVGRPKGRLSMDGLAVREKGALETIAGAPAVLSPRNVYFVQLRPSVIGMVYPADRQEVVRWVHDLRNTQGVVRLDPYLKAAVTGVGRATQFVLAIDLADGIDTKKTWQRLTHDRRLAGARPDEVAAARKAFATLQGLKLTLTVTDAIRGELRFDFGEPPGGLIVRLAKPLLGEFLAGHGAEIEALGDWTAEADGNSIVLRGPLRGQGFRRILSLVAPPAPPSGGNEGEPVAAEIRALETLRYFRTIQTYLDDLKNPSRSTQQDNAKFATWYDSFAQKVEQLPTYAVDEDVAKYGKATAARLRGIASSLRGDLVDVQKLEQSIGVTPYIYATSGWGRRLQPGVWLQSNEAEVRARQQTAIERGAQTRQDLWSRVENDSAQIAQALATRYQPGGG